MVPLCVCPSVVLLLAAGDNGDTRPSEGQDLQSYVLIPLALLTLLLILYRLNLTYNWQIDMYIYKYKLQMFFSLVFMSCQITCCIAW